MPRAAKSLPLQLDIKPYAKPPTPNSDPGGAEADDIKPTITKTTNKTKTNASPRKSRESTSRPWTTDELIALFEHVSRNGASGMKVWEGAVQGRTANQAYQTWLNSLAPYIRKAITNKPTKSKV